AYWLPAMLPAEPQGLDQGDDELVPLRLIDEGDRPGFLPARACPERDGQLGAILVPARSAEGSERDHLPGHVPAILQCGDHAIQVGAGDGGQGEGVRREPYQGRPILRRTRVRPDQRRGGGEVIGHRLIPPGAATGARRGRRLDRLARYFARAGVLLRLL